MLREDAYKLLVTLGTQAIEPTLQLLTSSDPQHHSMAVEILNRLASGGVIVPAEPLLGRLRANSAAYSAAQALGELAKRGVAVPVDEILSLLMRSDDDDYERHRAIVAFGERAAPHLIPLLGQEHPGEVRERAMEALESLWHHTSEEVFLAALRDETMPARWRLPSALGHFAASQLEGAAHAALVQAVSDSDPHVGAWAINALRNASLPIPVASLASVAHSPVWGIGKRAIEAMGYQRDHATISILTDLLRTTEAVEVRRTAAKALGCLAQQDVSVSLEPLKAAMRDDEDYRVRRAAFDALLSLGDRAPVHDMLAALDDSDAFLRQQMIEKLLSQDQRVPDEGWLALLGDADPKVRLLIASALAKRHPERCLPVLLDLLDEAADLGWAVRRAITNLGMSALHSLRLAMEDERPLVRHQVIILINEIVSAQREEVEIEAIPPELIVAALGDPEAKVRANMLTALAARRDAHETGLALAAIADSAAEVRSAALLSLKRLSAEAIDDVLAEAVVIVRDEEVGVLFDALAQSQVAGFIERATGDDGRLPLPLIAILTDLLQHSYWEVRAKAATALGKLRRGIPDLALQRLTHLLHDASRAVSLAADDALAQVLSLEAGIEDAE